MIARAWNDPDVRWASARRNTLPQNRRWRQAPSLREPAAVGRPSPSPPSARQWPSRSRQFQLQQRARHSAPRPDKKRERRSQRNNDRRNQWECKFLLPLHGEARRIETGLAETRDVIAELPHSSSENTGALRGESIQVARSVRGREVAVNGLYSATRPSAPKSRTHPAVNTQIFCGRLPACAGCEHAPAHLKVGGVSSNS